MYNFSEIAISKRNLYAVFRKFNSPSSAQLLASDFSCTSAKKNN